MLEEPRLELGGAEGEKEGGKSHIDPLTSRDRAGEPIGAEECKVRGREEPIQDWAPSAWRSG